MVVETRRPAPHSWEDSLRRAGVHAMALRDAVGWRGEKEASLDRPGCEHP